jgi:carboxypeptidase C (cathepsin A)
MRLRATLTALAMLAVLTTGTQVFAQDDPPAGKGDKPADSKTPPPPPLKFVSEHKLQAGGTDLTYTATAEEVYIHDGDNKPTASFFAISYTKKGVAKPEDRPVTFVYNGGPGSASIWLHFGLVGPRVVDIPNDASSPGVPPYHLKDNPWTILRATDVVFVDPVGTGFSHALGEKKDKDFWGHDEDADSVAEFIRTYLTTHNRWNSPKFLLGESYGGIRSAMLVPRLQERLSIELNGVILISPALNMATLPFNPNGNDLTYATHLPALASVAYYHHKLPDSWPNERVLLDEVEAFAGGEYLQALFKGDRLSPAERTKIAERLHRYTGLSVEYIRRSDLRIYALRYTKELLRTEGKVVGLLDGRFTQSELDKVGAMPDGDAVDSKTSPMYIALFQDYLHNDLKVDIERPYVGQNGRANGMWKRPEGSNNAFSGFVDVTDQLAQGTKDNESMHLFCAAGYQDLTTSYFATEYMLNHSGIDADKMQIKLYDGGHMMYLYNPSLQALSDDLVSFITKSHK